MLRSLISAVSGLRNHQVRMDVIGNNISNVNTVGFKSSRASFTEEFAQLLRASSVATANHGGVNPSQIGLGARVGSIDTLFTQGSLEVTGIDTDLAIQGDSFFVVSDGAQRYFTRAGNFRMDASGRLIEPDSGLVVQGRVAVDGQLVDGIQDISIPVGQMTAPRPTTMAKLAGNLNASAPVFDDLHPDANYPDPVMNPANRNDPANVNSFVQTSITTYDSLGQKQELRIVMWKSDTNEWSWEIDPDALSNVPNPPTVTGSTAIPFKTDGTVDLDALTEPEITFTPDGADDVTIRLDVTGLTNFGSASTAALREQDGSAAGVLESFSVDQSGRVIGAFSNGTTETLAQLVLANFTNPEGLVRAGNNNYSESANSGIPLFGYAQEEISSVVVSGALEMSNVDLAHELTDMIVAQRGFQANGRMITTSDEMLQELVNLRR